MPRPMDKARPREKRQRPMENEQEESLSRSLLWKERLQVPLFVMILRLICVIDSSVVLCLMLCVRMGLIGNTIVSRQWRNNWSRMLSS